MLSFRARGEPVSARTRLDLETNFDANSLKRRAEDALAAGIVEAAIA
jgi:hypothetical protein